jgi:hypothetical protein
MALWTPANAPAGTLAAWYDPSDGSSLTTSGGLISQVNDKSGNGRHASASGSLRVPTGTIGALGCFAPTGSQYLDATISSGTLNNQSSTFVVWDPNDSKPGEVAFSVGVSGSGYPNAELLISILANNYAVSGDDARGGSLYYFNPETGTQIYGCTQNLTSANLYNTGNLLTADGSTVSARTNANLIRIGNYTDAGYGANSKIGEVIHCIGLIGATLRQQIEGYLAWKWDGGSAGTLVGKLPSGHPYKSAAPVSDQALAPALFTNTNTFHSPAVSQGGGGQTLAPPLFTNSSIFYAPTVTRGTTTLTPGLVTNLGSFYAATVTATAALAPGLLTNSNTVYSPTVTRGAITISPALFTNASVFHAPTVFVPGEARSLLPALLLNASVIRLPAVSNDNPPGTYPLAIAGHPRTLRTTLAGGGAVTAGSIPSTGRVIATALKGRP